MKKNEKEHEGDPDEIREEKMRRNAVVVVGCGFLGLLRHVRK